MSDVTFNEPEYQQSRSGHGPKETFFTRVFIKLGLAKDEQSAQRAMLIVTIVIALAAVGIYFFFVRS